MFCKHRLRIFLLLFLFSVNAATDFKKGVKSEDLPVPGDPFATKSVDDVSKKHIDENKLQEQKEKHDQQLENFQQTLQEQTENHREKIEAYEKVIQKHRVEHNEEVRELKKMLQEQKEEHHKKTEEYEKKLQELDKKNQKLIDSQNAEMNTFLKSIIFQFFSNINIDLNSIEILNQNSFISLTNAEIKILKTFLSDSSSSSNSQLEAQKIFTKCVSKSSEKSCETIHTSQFNNLWIAIFVVLLSLLIYNRSIISQIFGKLKSPEPQKPTPETFLRDVEVEEEEETQPILPTISPSAAAPPPPPLPLPPSSPLPPPPPPPELLLPSGDLPTKAAHIKIQNTGPDLLAQIKAAIDARRPKISESFNTNESDDDDDGDSIVVINDQRDQQLSDNEEDWS